MRYLKIFGLSVFAFVFVGGTGAFAADFVRDLGYTCTFQGTVPHHGAITCDASGQIHATSSSASGTLALECEAKGSTTAIFQLSDSSVNFKANGHGLAIIGNEGNNTAAVLLQNFLPNAVAGTYDAVLGVKHNHGAIRSLQGSCQVTNLPTVF